LASRPLSPVTVSVVALSCLVVSLPWARGVACRCGLCSRPVSLPQPPLPLERVRICTYVQYIPLSHPHSPFRIPSPHLFPTARLSLTARKEDNHTRYRDGTPRVTLCTPRGPCSLLTAAAPQPTSDATAHQEYDLSLSFFSLHFQSRLPWLLSHPIKPVSEPPTSFLA